MPVAQESIRTIRSLLREQTIAFQKDYMTMVRAIRHELTLTKIVQLLNAGQIEDSIEVIATAAEKLPLAYNRTFDAAVASTRAFVRENLNVVIDLDRINSRALQANNRNRLELVREVVDTQRQTIRTTINDGIRTGLNPRDQARNIRQSIGLTFNQRRYIQRYREALSSPTGPKLSVLSRMLHDRRFNRTILRYNSQGLPLPPEKIEQMVENYYNRWVNYRATVISRTETNRALNIGRNNTYAELISQEGLRPEQVSNVWHTAQDERTRDSHRFMNNQQRIEGQAFESGLGNLLSHPADPSAPAEDSINCRCLTTRQIDFIGAQT